MNTNPGRIRQILTDGTGRAVFFWLILMAIWLSLQSTQGMGVDLGQIQSYLVLSLPLIVAAIGVTLVIIMGQFDLSAAGVIGIVNVIIASTLSSWNPLLVVVLMMALGGFIGLVNGLFVILGRLPAIAVTLATLIILQGLAIVILPQPSGKIPPFLVDGVRVPFVALGIIVVIIIAWMLFKRSRLGLYMFALGADPEALHLSGLPVKKIQLKIFVLAGALYGLAGVFMSASLGSGDGNAADSFLLTTFAAAAIGGTAFVGGLDLSVPGVIALSASIVAVWVSFMDGNLFVGILLALGVSLLFGIVNGLLVSVLKAPAFIVTLAMGAVLEGFSLFITYGRKSPESPELLVTLFSGSGKLFGIGIPALLFFVVGIIGFIIQARSRFGRNAYLLGSSLEASRIAGQPVNFIQISMYAVSGFGAGLAGLMLVTPNSALVQNG